jgi:hypothetical protein
MSRNTSQEWVRTENAFEPIIDRVTYERAQALSQEWRDRRTPEWVLARLRTHVESHGHLSKEVLDTEPTLPGSMAVANHFGSLTRAYEIIGYSKHPYHGTYQKRQNAEVFRKPLLSEAVEQLRGMGATSHMNWMTRTVWINDCFAVFFVIASQVDSPKDRWRSRLAQSAADMALILRMGADNLSLRELGLVPREDLPSLRGEVSDEQFALYRMENLREACEVMLAASAWRQPPVTAHLSYVCSRAQIRAT